MMLVCDEASTDFNGRFTQSFYDLTPDAYLESLWRGWKLRADKHPNLCNLETIGLSQFIVIYSLSLVMC